MIPNILFVWDLCVVHSFIVCFLVRCHVSEPYVMTGRIHWLYTLCFKDIGSLLVKTEFTLPNACHPSTICLGISISLSGVIVMV